MSVLYKPRQGFAHYSQLPMTVADIEASATATVERNFIVVYLV
jgi:hypothetical protein